MSLDKSCFNYFEKRRLYKNKYPKKSWREIDIKIFLDDNNIEYDEEVTASLKNNKTNYSIDIRVDFYIPKCNLIIEYNGEQHYKPIYKFGGIMAFEKQQERDSFLRDACKENNINLIEIPYYDSTDKYYKQILELYNT